MAGFCTNCGQPLIDGAAFCTSCGHKVVTVVANMSPTQTGQQPPMDMSAAMANQPQTGNVDLHKAGQPPQAPTTWQGQAPAPPLQAGWGNDAPLGPWLKLRREKQWYLVNPAIDVTIDQGQPFGLENGQEIVFPIAPGLHRLHFSCHVRSHDLDIHVQNNMCVQVSWDRLWGSLKAEVQPF